MNFPIHSRWTPTIECWRATPRQVQASYCTFNTNPAWSFGYSYYDHVYDPNCVLGDQNPMLPKNQTFIAVPPIPPAPNTRTTN